MTRTRAVLRGRGEGTRYAPRQTQQNTMASRRRDLEGTIEGLHREHLKKKVPHDDEVSVLVQVSAE